jgi:hypothetical protein
MRTNRLKTGYTFLLACAEQNENPMYLSACGLLKN